MEGNCDVGNVLIEMIPMKMITSDSTIANTGLFMNLVNISYCFLEW